ncbi:hypothetical protein ES703_92270 [subsurface metagenome]
MRRTTLPPTLNEIGVECLGLESIAGYADDFTTGAPIASVIGKGWALYWLSLRLDILVTQLPKNTYAVVAFSPKDFEKAEAGEYGQLDYFQGWLLQFDTHSQKWSLLAASQEVGRDEFIRLRREIIAG